MEMAWQMLVIGFVAGIAGGMFGIGGGAIMVPMLVMLFEAQGLPREHMLHVAVGTAMATVLFNSIASAHAHASLGAIRWDLAARITPGILAGGLVGSGIASVIPRGLFAALFTGVVYLAATNILLGRKPRASRQVPGVIGMFMMGFLISAVSAIGALGGAFITVPFLMYCNVPMLQAIGTAAAVGFPIGLAGTVGFVFTGWGQPGTPGPSLGYVYLPALAGILIASVLTAPLGARLAHRIPTTRLKQIFAIVLYLFATRMLVSLL
jgi:uncharacterized membrane protein YfcA